jgi:NosR/NirI family nitrous oxide reductase transcriptional regulator
VPCRRSIRALLAGAAILWLLSGGGALRGASAASPTPDGLDCAVIDCGAVLPGAVSFEEAPPAKYWIGLDAAGEVVGWVALSTDIVDIKAYSGKPLVTLVGIDPSAMITGARVLSHSEPILLTGIPESVLHDFADFYAGKSATERIVVGRSSRADAIAIDAISGATVTALAENQTIMQSARDLGSAVGVISLAAMRPGAFVEEEDPWTFEEMLDRKAIGRLTVSEAEMGSTKRSGNFIDLFFTIADAPQIGRSLMGDGEFEYASSQLAEDEHLVVVFGRGRESFKGSAFVRGGIFDRVRIRQGLREITFRDTDYKNLSGAAVSDAPNFKEGAVFVARGGVLDPGAPYEFVFLGSRYDQRGAFTREYHEFTSTHRLPKSVYVTESNLADSMWFQAWYNRLYDVIGLVIYLSIVIAIFVGRRYTTADPQRIKRLHLASLAIGFFYIGVHMGAQPSVTQILTFAGMLFGEWRFELFLSEPLIFILWIFITGVSLFWGRGVFCGWVCPYGAMNELSFKISSALGVKTFELPDAWHFRLRNLRYVVVALLVLVFLWDAALGERLAEVEPFKSTFLVPAWTRHSGFLAWWGVLIALSFVMYRPFCRYLCPLGGYVALISSFRPSGPRRRRFCGSCKICAPACESRAIRDNGTIDPRECLSCLDCEATYRNPNVCPPLLVIPRLESRDKLGAAQQKKLEKYRDGLEDV